MQRTTLSDSTTLVEVNSGVPIAQNGRPADALLDLTDSQTLSRTVPLPAPNSDDPLAQSTLSTASIIIADPGHAPSAPNGGSSASASSTATAPALNASTTSSFTDVPPELFIRHEIDAKSAAARQLEDDKKFEANRIALATDTTYQKFLKANLMQRLGTADDKQVTPPAPPSSPARPPTEEGYVDLGMPIGPIAIDPSHPSLVEPTYMDEAARRVYNAGYAMRDNTPAFVRDAISTASASVVAAASAAASTAASYVPPVVSNAVAAAASEVRAFISGEEQPPVVIASPTVEATVAPKAPPTSIATTTTIATAAENKSPAADNKVSDDMLYQLIEDCLNQKEFWNSKTWSLKFWDSSNNKAPEMIGTMQKKKKEDAFIKKDATKKILQMQDFAKQALEYTGVTGCLTNCISSKPFERYEETQQFYQHLAGINKTNLDETHRNLLEWMRQNHLKRPLANQSSPQHK